MSAHAPESGRRPYSVLNVLLRYQVLLGGLGVLAYVFAYVAQRSLMTLLGVPVGRSIEPLAYANVVLAAFMAAMLCATVLLLLLAIAFLPARLVGVRLSGWRARAPLRPLPGYIFLVAIAGTIFPHLLLAGTFADFNGLLVSVPPADPSSLLLTMIDPDGVRIARIGLFGTLVLALALLVLVLQTQAAPWPWERAGLASRGITAMSAVLLVLGVFLLPVSFAILWLPKDFPNVLVERESTANLGAVETFDGQLLLATENDVVLYGKPADGPAEAARIIVLGRAFVPMIRLMGGSANVAKRHICGETVSQATCPTGADARRALSLWALVATACIAFAGLAALAAPPAAAAGAQTTMGAAAVPPADRSPEGDSAAAPPPAADTDESEWLIDFFPLLAEHIQQVIALFANVIELMARGDEELAAPPPLTAAVGDVWRYDLGSATTRRITSDGDYATPIPAPDDGRVAVVHGRALALLDPVAGSRRTIDETSDYARVLAWSADQTELLALTREGELRRVRIADGVSRSVALDPNRHPLARIEALTALSHVTAGLAYLRTQPTGDASWIVRDSPDFDFAQAVFKFDGQAHDPAESADGTTIFVIGEER